MNKPTRGEIPRLVELAVFGAAAVLCAAVLLMFVARLSGRMGEVAVEGPEASEAQRTAQSDAAAASPAAATGKPAGGPRQAAVQAIQERNVFQPPKPQGFQGQFTGVLGDKAVFNGGQMAKVGESVMGAKVLAIGADWVEIEFEGNTRKMELFSGGGGRGGPSAGPNGPRPGRPAGPGNPGSEMDRRGRDRERPQ